MDDGTADPRTRAAETKRVRTRAALIAAADSAFGSRSWAATRVEDIAAAAGVSAATAYNHFPSKHPLVAAVFEPHVRALVRQAEADLAAGRSVVDALTDQVRGLSRLSWHHRGLTAAFTAAVFDYTIRTGQVPDPADTADPRNVAPLLRTLLLLVEHGQATGHLRPHPPAPEIASIVVNLLLVRSLNRPDEPPEATADLLLTVLWGVLRPDLLDTLPRPDGNGRAG